MAKKDYSALADAIIEKVGGKANISYLTHCVTRLRFNVKDRALANLDDLNNISGVLGTQWAGDQLQVIIGQTVADAYDAICKKTGLEKQAAIDEQLDDIKPARDWSLKGILNLFLETISSIIAPFIPAIVGCGLTQEIGRASCRERV